MARRAGLAISSPFGWRADPILGIKRRHDGVDLPGASGTPIFATGAGVVRIAGWARGYGNFIEILHPGGIATRYGHLSRYDVVPGQEVRRGDIIAFSGATGRATSPHLHFEVRMGGAAVNPHPYLTRSAMVQSARSELPF